MAGRYLTIGSKFKPFSYAEMVAPAKAATDTHNQIEEGLSELSSQAGVWENLANQQTDPKAYAQYKAYSDDLLKQADLLARDGLTPQSRRGLSSMKKRYSSDIVPIQMAHTKREELTKSQREALAKDPSLMFDTDYSVASLDSLMANPSASYNTISGSQLTAKAGQMASALSKTLRDNPQYQSILGGQYFQQMQQFGYTPEEIMMTIMNDSSAPKELKQIADTVYREAGLDNWDQKSQLRARDYISSGLYNAIGSMKADTQANRGYMSPAEAERLSMAREQQTWQREQRNEKINGIDLGDGSRYLSQGSGKGLIIYDDPNHPDKPEGVNFKLVSAPSAASTKAANTSISKGLASIAKSPDEPLIIANVRGEWKSATEGESAGNLFQRNPNSNLTEGKRYTLDNVNPQDIVEDLSEIPKEAAQQIIMATKGIDLNQFVIVRVKAKESRKEGDYDYVLYPAEQLKKVQQMSTKTTAMEDYQKSEQPDVEEVDLDAFGK